MMVRFITQPCSSSLNQGVISNSAGIRSLRSRSIGATRACT